MTPRRAAPNADSGSEDGSSVVEFVLVTILVLFLFLVVMQIGQVLHARNVLVAAAAEGARFGANADRADEDGAVRALQVVAGSLPGTVADSATARAVPRAAGADPQLVDIELSSDLPVIFLKVGPLHLTVHGHALKEGG